MISGSSARRLTYRTYFPAAALFAMLGGLWLDLSLDGQFSAAGFGFYLPILIGALVLFAAILHALFGLRSYRAEHPAS